MARNQVSIEVTADTKQARRGLKGVGTEARKMGDQMNTSGRTSVTALRGIVTGVVALGAVRGLFDMAMSFGGGRGVCDYQKWIEDNLNKMTVPEIEGMLKGLSLAVNHFSSLRDKVQKRRDAYYRRYR